MNPEDGASKMLVTPVTYGADPHLEDFLRSMESRPATVDLVLIDNSPSGSGAWHDLPESLRKSVTRVSYDDNPGYIGGMQRFWDSLDEVTANSYSSVVLCNTDITLDPSELAVWQDGFVAEFPDLNWILAPDVREGERAVPLNPHILLNPSDDLVPAAVQRSMRILSQPYPVALSYRIASIARRVIRPSSRGHTPRRQVFAPHGCFMVFGRGFLQADADFNDLPLFNEELAVGAIARALETPVFFDPGLRVDHIGRGTTGGFLSLSRHRLARPSAQFYRSWTPPTRPA